MRLVDAVTLFITAKYGEVAPETVRSLYQRNADGTHGGRLAHLLSWFGDDADVEQISVHDLRRWRNDLLSPTILYETHPRRPEQAGRLHPRTVFGIVSAARRLFSWLAAEEILETNPAKRLKPPPIPDSPPRAVDRQAAWKMLQTARLLAVRDFAAYQLLTHCELSYKELLAIRMKDLDFVNCRLRIWRKRRVRRDGRRVVIREEVWIDVPALCQDSLRSWVVSRPELAGEDEEDLWAGRGDQFRELYRGGIVFGVRLWAFLETLASTACRVSEVSNLTMDRLKIADGYAVVYGKGKGGLGKMRFVFLDEAAKQALACWLRVRPECDSEYVFVGETGKKIQTRSQQRLLQALAEVAGVKGSVNAHAWRHFWAIEALRNGSDLATVARVLGHSDVKVTADYYLRFQFQELQERHGRYSWKNGDRAANDLPPGLAGGENKEATPGD